MKPLNEPENFVLRLTEASQLSITRIRKVKDVVVDISGGSFKWNLLDKQGGTILDTITTSLTTDGTDGSYTGVFEIAELAALITAGTLPLYHELFFSSDTTAEKFTIWSRGLVVLSRSGS